MNYVPGTSMRKTVNIIVASSRELSVTYLIAIVRLDMH